MSKAEAVTKYKELSEKFLADPDGPAYTAMVNMAQMVRDFAHDENLRAELGGLV